MHTCFQVFIIDTTPATNIQGLQGLDHMAGLLATIWGGGWGRGWGATVGGQGPSGGEAGRWGAETEWKGLRAGGQAQTGLLKIFEVAGTSEIY